MTLTGLAWKSREREKVCADNKWQQLLEILEDQHWITRMWWVWRDHSKILWRPQIRVRVLPVSLTVFKHWSYHSYLGSLKLIILKSHFYTLESTFWCVNIRGSAHALPNSTHPTVSQLTSQGLNKMLFFLKIYCKAFLLCWWSRSRIINVIWPCIKEIQIFVYTKLMQLTFSFTQTAGQWNCLY